MSPSTDRAKRWLKNVFRKPSRARALPPKRVSSVTSATSRPVAADQTSSPNQDQPPSTHSAAVPSTESPKGDHSASSSPSAPSADGDRDLPQSRVKAAVDALPRVLSVASAALEVAEAFGAAFPPVQPALKIAKKGLDGVKVNKPPCYVLSDTILTSFALQDYDEERGRAQSSQGEVREWNQKIEVM
jgi:hypothetical protein